MPFRSSEGARLGRFVHTICAAHWPRMDRPRAGSATVNRASTEPCKQANTCYACAVQSPSRTSCCPVAYSAVSRRKVHHAMLQNILTLSCQAPCHVGAIRPCDWKSANAHADATQHKATAYFSYWQLTEQDKLTPGR